MNQVEKKHHMIDCLYSTQLKNISSIEDITASDINLAYSFWKCGFSLASLSKVTGLWTHSWKKIFINTEKHGHIKAFEMFRAGLKASGKLSAKEDL